MSPPRKRSAGTALAKPTGAGDTEKQTSDQITADGDARVAIVCRPKFPYEARVTVFAVFGRCDAAKAEALAAHLRRYRCDAFCEPALATDYPGARREVAK